MLSGSEASEPPSRLYGCPDASLPPSMTRWHVSSARQNIDVVGGEGATAVEGDEELFLVDDG